MVCSGLGWFAVVCGNSMDRPLNRYETSVCQMLSISTFMYECSQLPGRFLLV